MLAFHKTDSPLFAIGQLIKSFLKIILGSGLPTIWIQKQRSNERCFIRMLLFFLLYIFIHRFCRRFPGSHSKNDGSGSGNGISACIYAFSCR